MKDTKERTGNNFLFLLFIDSTSRKYEQLVLGKTNSENNVHLSDSSTKGVTNRGWLIFHEGSFNSHHKYVRTRWDETQVSEGSRFSTTTVTQRWRLRNIFNRPSSYDSFVSYQVVASMIKRHAKFIVLNFCNRILGEYPAEYSKFLI